MKPIDQFAALALLAVLAWAIVGQFVADAMMHPSTSVAEMPASRSEPT